MTFFLLIAVHFVGASSSPMDEWVDFVREYGKVYRNTAEEVLRMKVFFENMAMIMKHNLNYAMGFETYYLKMNRFGDLTNNEFKQLMTKLKITKFLTNNFTDAFGAKAKADVPPSFDWRRYGAVTPVKDQGQCGSCWAFSTTGSLEGQMFRKTGRLVSLSEQKLVDCSKENSGCNCGLMTRAFKYIKDNGGIDTAESYPYQGTPGSCRFNRSAVGGTVTGYTRLKQGDEEALKKAIATVGPISVVVNAGLKTFQFYKGDVYTDRSCSKDYNHAVLAVGYGSEKGQNYWIIKNSWGTGWGDGGYMKLARNENNLCGIAELSCYPYV